MTSCWAASRPGGTPSCASRYSTGSASISRPTPEYGRKHIDLYGDSAPNRNTQPITAYQIETAVAGLDLGVPLGRLGEFRSGRELPTGLLLTPVYNLPIGNSRSCSLTPACASPPCVPSSPSRPARRSRSSRAPATTCWRPTSWLSAAPTTVSTMPMQKALWAHQLWRATP
ncbi:hypothetical protein ACU4GD_40600 [Cupriavidus basilensis]